MSRLLRAVRAFLYDLWVTLWEPGNVELYWEHQRRAAARHDRHADARQEGPDSLDP